MASIHRTDKEVSLRASARNWAGRACAAAILLIGAITAHAQTPSYQFTAPAGWTRTEQAGAIAFTPQSEPRGSVVLMILPIAPRLADLDAQLTALRTAFEGSLGLRNMREPLDQRGSGSGFETRTHCATYSSDQGDRYLAVMGRAEAGLVGTVLFVATNGDAYNRLRGTAAAFFDNLRVDGAGAPQSPQAMLPPAPAGHAPAPVTAAAGGSSAAAAASGVSVWMAFKWLIGPYSSGQHPRWLTLFADSEILDDIPTEGLVNFERQSAHMDPNLQSSWGELRGGEIVKPGVRFPTKVVALDAGRMKLDSDVYYRCAPVDGLRLDGAWTTLDQPNDPALDRLPLGRRPLFRFSGDGRFSDEGVFLTALSAGNDSQTGSNRSGQGRYEIAAFTLTLRYDDGRVKRLAITGLLGGDLAHQDSILFISRMRFNKRA